MPLPELEKGLIINYSYLWHREARDGVIEGRKNRPCAIVIATSDQNVAVVPITHSKPQPGIQAIEVPSHLSKELGLDDQISWIITTEYNLFRWPGYDIRPKGHGGEYIYGRLPHHILLQVTKLVADNIRSKSSHAVNRD